MSTSLSFSILIIFPYGDTLFTLGFETMEDFPLIFMLLISVISYLNLAISEGSIYLLEKTKVLSPSVEKSVKYCSYYLKLVLEDLSIALDKMAESAPFV